MENASEALKMAGAMLIFVMALTITIISFTAARQASDSIVSTYGQLTTFYDYELYQNTGSYREVNSDEIVANLYSYYQSNNTILFYWLKRGTYDRTTKTFSQDAEIERLALYETPTSNKVTGTGKLSNLQKSFLRKGNGKTDNNREIYGLDIQDETITRNEAWKGTAGDAKIFIDCLVSGEDYENTNISKSDLNNSWTRYEGGKLIIKFKYKDIIGKSFSQASDRLFIERDGEYISSSKAEENATENTTSWKDVVANSTENLNDEVLENNTAATKKVIQYIYIPTP
jgi:hypothetical protein